MDIFKWLSQLDTVIGLLTFFIVSALWIRGWRKHLGSHTDIEVVLVYQNETKPLPLYLKRKEVERKEVLGRIGMIPRKEGKDQFSLIYLSNPEFLQKLGQILDGELDILEIPCSEEEYNQFEL